MEVKLSAACVKTISALQQNACKLIVLLKHPQATGWFALVCATLGERVAHILVRCVSSSFSGITVA